MTLDPLFANLPPLLKEWVETQDINRLVGKYGWTVCSVCGKFGIAWSTDAIPAGFNLEMEHNIAGYLHPRVEGSLEIWNQDKIAEHPTEPLLFDRYMRSINNTIDSSLTYEQMTKGATNPYDFCVGKSSLGKRQGEKHGVCPRCGEPGTGEGIVRNERRFFHSSSQSCYLGMVEPTRAKGPQVECSKCGEPGRESLSKGYRYVRHKNKVCYIGRISNEST